MHFTYHCWRRYRYHPETASIAYLLRSGTRSGNVMRVPSRGDAAVQEKATGGASKLAAKWLGNQGDTERPREGQDWGHLRDQHNDYDIQPHGDARIYRA